MGIAMGHRVRLSKKLRELRPEPLLSPSRVAPPPVERTGPSPSRPKQVTLQEPGAGTGTGSLLDGEYDEEANAASFAEAVAQWRRGGAEDAAPASPQQARPTPNFSAGPGAFWSKVGGTGEGWSNP